ncbi:acetyl-CoA carboxylase biotin carboxylase subunit [Planctomycetota bacterium]
MFKKILISNRGEIAIRLMHACQELGVPTVAVYSDVDSEALHVQESDEAVFIGPAAPAKSYLNIDKIIATAKETGADAIHPGYGFLAENAEFAARCQREGITFIGPNSKAIVDMGNKLSSRKTAIAHDIPVIPGSKGQAQDAPGLLQEASEIGFPVLIKAAAGGGGKGMRVVDRAEDFQAGLEMAMSESKKAFGDDTVFLEKYITNARHIEFQVLGDRHGNVIHLFERECSIQRRHQKIVEETPSPAITPDMRAEMGAAAVRLARAVEYDSAGTVEFILDADNNTYYLLEMNTRIQVEHPITEMVTSVDLVQWQIRIAAGEKLTLRQEDVTQQGHAIECRVYAEDAENNFFPSPGKLLVLEEPRGPGIRNDTGVYAGFTVTVDYDPMISKLVTWARDRDACRRRMKRALEQYKILGVKTTIGFLVEVMDHAAFASGETYTNFIPTHFPDWHPKQDDSLLHEAMLGVALYESGCKPGAHVAGATRQPGPWQTIGRWEIGGQR